MNNTSLRFGLIGFGAWGKHHADAIRKTEDVELAAIAARSEASAAAAKEAFPNAAVFTDYRKMIETMDLDLVDVVVPSHLHHEMGTAVLESGAHLLLEKPMGVSVSECDDLVRLAKEKNLHLAVGHEFRLSSLWGKVKSLIDEGYVGDPQYALVELSRNPYRQGSDGWRYDIDRVGNWILEEPIHFFDLARWYLGGRGEPQSVVASANSRQPDHPELQDNFSALVNFHGGAYAVVSQTLSAFEHHQTVKVTGTKGALWASWSGALDRTRHPTFALRGFNGEAVEDISVGKVTGELFELEDQIQMLADVLKHDQPIACNADDGRWSVLLCLAAQESVDTQSIVRIDEFAERASR
ncbi:Gfo/Idh/MocA family protein [Roseimaritima ulvae]|uniref:Putative oxidoreductase YvaA n=1 Tax=Roseimaritima ulvae TaxID=980254 RepID=A0A5B9QVV4_9BACT|nr:Gfo/Idh/MocA family oxidoreductase [Roseimaritima ulvae]QEG43177.1 putative oxidoreductase YvaA [Roseimaritima ulvae]